MNYVYQSLVNYSTQSKAATFNQRINMICLGTLYLKFGMTNARTPCPMVKFTNVLHLTKDRNAVTVMFGLELMGLGLALMRYEPTTFRSSVRHLSNRLSCFAYGDKADHN